MSETTVIPPKELVQATVPMCPGCGAEMEPGPWSLPYRCTGCGKLRGNPNYGYYATAAALPVEVWAHPNVNIDSVFLSEGAYKDWCEDNQFKIRNPRRLVVHPSYRPVTTTTDKETLPKCPRCEKRHRWGGGPAGYRYDCQCTKKPNQGMTEVQWIRHCKDPDCDSCDRHVEYGRLHEELAHVSALLDAESAGRNRALNELDEANAQIENTEQRVAKYAAKYDRRLEDILNAKAERDEALARVKELEGKL